MTREQQEERDNMESLLSQNTESVDLQPVVDALNLIARVLYLGLDCIVSNQARAAQGNAPAYGNFTDPIIEKVVEAQEKP